MVAPPSTTNSPTNDSPRFPYLGVSVLFVFGIAIGHCYWKGDFLAATVCGIILMGGFLGYCCGLLKTIGSSVGCLAGYGCASQTSGTVQDIFGRLFQRPLPASTATLVGGILIGFATILTFWIVGAIVFRRSRRLKRFDQVSGFVLGFVNTGLLVALVLWGLLSIEAPIAQLANNETSPAQQPPKIIAVRLNQWLTATKNSYVMLPLAAWNPWTEIPYLQSYRDRVCHALSSSGESQGANSEQPTGLEQFIQHPKVQKLLGQGVENSNPIHGLEIVGEHAGTLVNKVLQGDLGKIK